MLDAWIIGIVGVICLGVLLEILLPEGQTGKYVKGAFSLMVVFVIVAPLPSVAKALENWQPTYGDMAVDEDFLEETTEYGEERAARALESALNAKGYVSEVKVVIMSGSLSEFDEIVVTVRLPVLAEEETNKHISDIVGTAVEVLDVDADRVSVTFAWEGGNGSE